MSKCPECDGKGGATDGWGEWDDCPCCLGYGYASPDRISTYRANIEAMDAEIDRMMRNSPAPG